MPRETCQCRRELHINILNDNTSVKYSVIDDSNNLFVSKYQMYLPTEEELRAEIERDVLELGV